MNLKKAKDNKKFIMAVLAISVVAVMFIPMLYSSLYLGSVWDVYGKLDKVPVAFVNSDKSITKDGKEYAVGKEVEDNLKDNTKVAWKFVNHEDAMNGVEGTKYYAVIEIPADFSEKIADAQDGDFKNPEIIYIGNKGRNFVFSQVSSKVAESVKAEVSSSIQKEISKALVDSLYDVKVSIKDAGDGAGELQSGTQKLLDGSKDLATGAQSAADGSMQLESGLRQAAEASAKLQDGTQKLLNGSTDLSNGLNEAAGGSKQLLAGLKSITDGQKQVVSGSGSLADGLKELKSNLTKPNDQIPQLVKGAADLNTNAGAISQGAAQLDNSFGTLANGITQADSMLHDELANIDNSNLSQADKDKLKAAISAVDQVSRANAADNSPAPLTKAAYSAHQLSVNLQLLQTGTQKVSDGVSGLAVGLGNSQNAAAAALDKLIGGAQGIQGGSSSILEGLNTVTDKTGALAGGLDTLSSGAASLKDGLKTVNDGNVSLKAGLSTAAAKTGELASGLKELSSGSTSLKDGLNDANEGAVKLSDGLKDGYNKISGNLKFNSDNMSQFISEPVTLKDSSINVVNHYGEGLGPYFISLSLWLGAMFISMILTFAKSLKVFKNKFMNSFSGRFVVGIGLVSIQALILSVTLIKGVGVNPVNAAGFYVTNIFIAAVFFSIMYGVAHAIGILGAPIMFILLILQLASSGGTFPIETAPAAYKVIGKFVPMTYSVNTLRMIISGINSSLLKHNILIMLIFMLGFLCGGFILKAITGLVKKKNHIIRDTQAA